jgi:hypothetical protein
MPSFEHITLEIRAQLVVAYFKYGNSQLQNKILIREK